MVMIREIGLAISWHRMNGRRQRQAASLWNRCWERCRKTQKSRTRMAGGIAVGDKEARQACSNEGIVSVVLGHGEWSLE